MNRRNFIKTAISLPLLVSGDIDPDPLDIVKTEALIKDGQAEYFASFADAIIREISIVYQIPEKLLRTPFNKHYSAARFEILSRKRIS